MDETTDKILERAEEYALDNFRETEIDSQRFRSERLERMVASAAQHLDDIWELRARLENHGLIESGKED